MWYRCQSRIEALVISVIIQLALRLHSEFGLNSDCVNVGQIDRRRSWVQGAGQCCVRMCHLSDACRPGHGENEARPAQYGIDIFDRRPSGSQPHGRLRQSKASIFGNEGR